MCSTFDNIVLTPFCSICVAVESNPCFDTSASGSKMYSNLFFKKCGSIIAIVNYPEKLHTCFRLHSPFFFAILLILPWSTEMTNDVIEFVLKERMVTFGQFVIEKSGLRLPSFFPRYFRTWIPQLIYLPTLPTSWNR